MFLYLPTRFLYFPTICFYICPSTRYPGVSVTNMSTAWKDGLAFCALIHVFYPDNFDWFSLKSENRRHNFTLAFQKAE